MKVTHQFYQKKVSQILLWFSENSRKCPSMAFFNNLATFRIVNNQIFIFVYKIIPLGTNSPLSKDSNTDVKVIFPSERQNLANNSTDLDLFDGKISKRWRFGKLSHRFHGKNSISRSISRNIFAPRGCKFVFTKYFTR